MGSLFSKPPSPPPIKPPAPMPDEGAIAREKQKAVTQRMQSSGRASTLLSDREGL